MLSRYGVPRPSISLHHFCSRLLEKSDQLAANLIASGQRENQFQESEFNDSDAESSNSDSLGSDYSESLSSNDPQPKSELHELYLSVNGAITSLLKLSILIRNPVPRDRYSKSSQLDSYDDSYDILHARAKFPHTCDQAPWLADRLGKANTRRRQYFRYCQLHRERLSKESEDTVPREDTLGPVPVLEHHAQDELKSRIESHRPSTKLSSKPAQTEATEFIGKDEVEVEKDVEDTQSIISFATSVVEETEEDLRLPLAPEASSNRLPFECPYCYTIQVCKRPSHWRCVRNSCI